MARSLRPFAIRRAPALALGTCAITVTLIGCFASIDRSRIDDGLVSGSDAGPPLVDAPMEALFDAGSPTVDGGGLLPGQSPCGTKHDFCVDFDLGGSAPADFGFDLALAGSGTGMVTIGSGGDSPPRCAHVATNMDPMGGVPNFSDGLAHSIDATRAFELAFDVMVQMPNWTGYDATHDFEIATVASSDDTAKLALHVPNPKLVDGGIDQLLVDLVGPGGLSQVESAHFAFGSWVHVDILVAPSGLIVTVGGKSGFSHGAVSFESASGAPTAFVLGIIRPTKGAPASAVRIDNVVLDYR